MLPAQQLSPGWLIVSMIVTLQIVSTLMMLELHALLVSLFTRIFFTLGDTFTSVLQAVHMAVSDWGMVLLAWMGEWRCVSMDTGGLFVIICGQQLMPMWPVDNLVILALVSDNTIVVTASLVLVHLPFGRCNCVQQCTLWTKCWHHHSSWWPCLHNSSDQVDWLHSWHQHWWLLSFRWRWSAMCSLWVSFAVCDISWLMTRKVIRYVSSIHSMCTWQYQT